MRYSILGPLKVRDVSLGQGRQRLLLAVLLLNRNEVLSSERLIEALWGEAPPPTAAGSLHNLVSALRKALGNGALVTHGHGYALTVASGELDADAFEALAARGRAALADGDAGEAAALLREALALWRGPALGELAYDLPASARRLDDLKLGAIEDRIDADLALGRHAELVAELAELVESHPARERLRGQQMLALYRCDRQAEALAAYQDFRRRLGDELGLLPAPALRALERGILEHDPALGASASPRRIATAVPRRPRWLAVAAALILAAPIALLLRGGAAHPEPVRVVADSVVVIDPASNRITASYPVGATPSSVTVGGGAAWTVSADAQTISRIDLRERTTRTFATGSVPLEVAAGRDALWLVAARGSAADGPLASVPALLTRIDPRSTAVAGSTTLEPRGGPAVRGAPGLVALGDDAVWVIGRDGRLSRHDRRSGQVSAVRGLSVMNVAAGDGQVWAVAETTRPSQQNLVSLDPVSGRVLDGLHVPWVSVADIAVGAGAVWLTDPSTGVVWRVDPGPVPVVQTIPADFGVDSIATAARSVWAANSVTGTVHRIDPVTNRVTARVATGGTPRSVALGGDRVWVAVAGGERRSAGPSPRLAKVRPLTAEGCGALLTAPGASPDLLLVADLPLQKQFLTTTQPMAAAVVSVLRARGFRAGRFRVAVQTCDDSTAAANGPDAAKCTSNAKAYADHPAVIGVVGPMHSFCTEAMLPVLNGASGGPVTLVSPTNSHVSLVRRSPDAPAGLLRRLYPAGQRGYARVSPSDDAVLAATAVAAKRLGAQSVFYLVSETDAGSPWRVFFRRGARRIGLHIAGSQTWDQTASDFGSIARRVRASRAQAVVIDGSVFVRVGAVIRDLRRVLGPDYPIVATDSALPITQLFDEAGPAARGVRIVVGGRQPERLGATGRRFVDSFGATRPDGRVSQWDVHAAAATEVLLDAIARSDGTRESVARALATTHLADSPLGPLALDRRGEPDVAHATVVRAERGGAPLFVNGVEGGVIESEITLPARGF